MADFGNFNEANQNQGQGNAANNVPLIVDVENLAHPTVDDPLEIEQDGVTILYPALIVGRPEWSAVRPNYLATSIMRTMQYNPGNANLRAMAKIGRAHV